MKDLSGTTWEIGRGAAQRGARATPASFTSGPARQRGACCSWRGDGTHVEPASQHEQQAAAANGGRPPRVSFRQPKAKPSSWAAKEAGGGRHADADYLFELGASQQYNINVSHGQTAGMIDSLFVGDRLGHSADIADGSLRTYEFRTFNNIQGDYYIAPRFLEKVAMHIAKNFLMDSGSFDPSTKVPLILGIWGGKGQGKTFQTELCFKKLGVEPVIMSAGELEHEWAGTPGKMIRERYRRAAEVSKVHGKLSCLMINDLDAGIGHFENTQRDAGIGHFENTQITVNNQMVVGTLMNICDNPKQVSVGQGWAETDIIKRIPIIVTGNDFSTVFAPLVRDGRMDKYYWHPTEEDLVAILHQMYRDDGLSEGDMATLLRTFPNQTLDFFGALRASTYDQQIRDWIKKDVVHGEIAEENENMRELGRRLLAQEGLPQFEPVDLTLAMLLEEGRRLVQEQEMVNSMRLSDEYLKKQRKMGRSMIGLSG
ncbi:ribulose bisphosphate carboxylase oxygenase chloroplastic isoform C [Chlorella sorokiniana]|uniref:Ribulose bisphosphate carboxylase/oxygenase activase, chloroplastic n=1 Tax=Chlorella sorokiniana TaxID=3076 RepID=A0A2P6TKR1_CHLSO|nr:ribulose bisphosphate carboxylase oxygenase chloroplastic isoform C [Chlorella sorokiniana]|eukprot:PRW44880.1 ribulose bisphosphate carboxylase oxygenase chloroplastic isoform C [Chlorella sorokiniana]